MRDFLRKTLARVCFWRKKPPEAQQIEKEYTGNELKTVLEDEYLPDRPCTSCKWLKSEMYIGAVCTLPLFREIADKNNDRFATMHMSHRTGIRIWSARKKEYCGEEGKKWERITPEVFDFLGDPPPMYNWV